MWGNKANWIQFHNYSVDNCEIILYLHVMSMLMAAQGHMQDGD